MNWKMLSFIFIPLLLAGCMAYSFKAAKEGRIISQEVLQNKIELEPIFREFDGSQG